VADSGLPVGIKTSAQAVTKPTVTWAKDEGIPHIYLSRGYVSGSGETGTLTGSGARFIELLTGDFEAPPPLPPPAPKSSKTTKKKKKQ
jgi:hypothetical protein